MVKVITSYESLKKEQGENEFVFNSEVLLPHQVFNWQHKYTPQKPIFYNKIKMGFEWNQYNQVHYDINNPPPKVIQGYRFNIFYPDLIDKSQRPSYTIEVDKTDDNWCILRFHAGAPYEDIAFRVILFFLPNRPITYE